MENKPNIVKLLLSEVETLKNRVQQLENAQHTEGKIWTPHDVANFAGCSYGYVIQTLTKDPAFPPTLGDPRPRAPKKYFATDVITFFKNRNPRECRK